MNKVISVIILGLLFIKNPSFSQIQRPDYKDLIKSIETNLDYPSAFAERCISTFGLIKVTVNGSSVDVDISDSLDPLIRIGFLAKSKNLNVGAIIQYCIDNHVNEHTVLLPVSFRAMGCLVQNINSEIAAKETLFNGKPFTGNAVLLQPIDFTVTKPIR